MDPNKLPAGTEYTYTHLFMPSRIGGGFSIAPINPSATSNTPFSLSELDVRYDRMSALKGKPTTQPRKPRQRQ